MSYLFVSRDRDGAETGTHARRLRGDASARSAALRTRIAMDVATVEVHRDGALVGTATGAGFDVGAAVTIPTPAQRRVLEIVASHAGGGNGLAEAALEYGSRAPGALQWATVQRVAAVLERRGWIGADGEITDAGRAVLRGVA